MLKEKGSILIEFTLGIALLTVLITGLADTGMMLSKHLRMTQIAREGVRYAVGLAELEPGVPAGKSFVNIHDPSLLLAQQHPNQHLVQNRISLLMTIERLRFKSVQVTTIYDPNPDSDLLTNDEQVKVNISGTYAAFFPLFDNMTISVTETGPYLY